MRKVECPCYGCEDRRVENDQSCHSTCERYAAYRAELDRRKEEERKRIEADGDFVGFKQASFRRVK